MPDNMGQVLKESFYRVLVVLHLVLLESKGNFHTFWMQLSWLQCALLIYSQACHQKNQLGPNQIPFWINKNQIANKNIKRELVVLAWVRSQKMNEINPAAIVLKVNLIFFGANSWVLTAYITHDYGVIWESDISKIQLWIFFPLENNLFLQVMTHSCRYHNCSFLCSPSSLSSGIFCAARCRSSSAYWLLPQDHILHGHCPSLATISCMGLTGSTVFPKGIYYQVSSRAIIAAETHSRPNFSFSSFSFTKTDLKKNNQSITNYKQSACVHILSCSEARSSSQYIVVCHKISQDRSIFVALYLSTPFKSWQVMRKNTFYTGQEVGTARSPADTILRSSW